MQVAIIHVLMDYKEKEQTAYSTCFVIRKILDSKEKSEPMICMLLFPKTCIDHFVRTPIKWVLYLIWFLHIKRKCNAPNWLFSRYRGASKLLKKTSSDGWNMTHLWALTYILYVIKKCWCALLAGHHMATSNNRHCGQSFQCSLQLHLPSSIKPGSSVSKACWVHMIPSVN